MAGDFDRIAERRLRAPDLVLEVFEFTLQSLLNSIQFRGLAELNAPRLLQLRLANHQEKLVQIQHKLEQHLAATDGKKHLEVLTSLIEVQQRYTNLNEIADYPLAHNDWLQTYGSHIVKLLANGRVLNGHRVDWPVLEHSAELCRKTVRDFNQKFVEFVWDKQHGYPAWVAAKDRAERPMLTSDVVRETLLPALEKYRTVFFIIFDGMSLLSWTRIRDNYQSSAYKLVSDDLAMAVVPTATRFARSAIFRGELPIKYMSSKQTKNLNERRLLEMALRDAGSSVTIKEKCFVKYEESAEKNQDAQTKADLQRLIAAEVRLKVIIVDPHDKVTHIASHDAEDFAEVFYRVSIHPIMQQIAKLRDTAVVITSDHGFCEISKIRRVKGIFRSGNVFKGDYLYSHDPQRQGHFGKRYIDLGDREFDQRQSEAWVRCIPDPEMWGLPGSNGFVIAVGDSGFGLDEGETLMFAHGGVSLEEMIVPVVVLATQS